MTRWALIRDGVATDVTDTDPDGRFHPSLVWTVVPDDLDRNSRLVDGVWTPPPSAADPGSSDPLPAQRTQVIVAINAKCDEVLAGGALIGETGLHVALDDGSRADVGGMATTAIAVMLGAAEWPEAYSQGWITIENIRIPMPTPADGIALAFAVGQRYAAIRQNARTLKDEALVSVDPASININTGWPE